MTQTCVSQPPTTISGRSGNAAAKSGIRHASKLILAKTGAAEPPASSGTVAPSPEAFSSVISTGTPNICAAFRSRRALATIAAPSAITGISRLWKSISSSAELSRFRVSIGFRWPFIPGVARGYRSLHRCRQGAAALHSLRTVAFTQRLDRLGEPSRPAHCGIEQRRQIGFRGIDEAVGADPDQAEPGYPVGLAPQQRRGGLEQEVGQLGRIGHRVRARAEPKIGGLQL